MSNIPREKSFWSMIIDSNCKQTFTVERAFHISKAVIDWPMNEIRSPVARLMVDCDNKIGIILCELMKNDFCSLKPEADLDVHFRVGQKIKLYSEFGEILCAGLTAGGKPRIHLSGYEFVV